jgi:hypothetical protein
LNSSNRLAPDELFMGLQREREKERKCIDPKAESKLDRKMQGDFDFVCEWCTPFFHFCLCCQKMCVDKVSSHPVRCSFVAPYTLFGVGVRV